MKHKWHKEIKAWADGAEIEFAFSVVTECPKWNIVGSPDWNDERFIYRIKPQPKEPQYLYVYKHRTDGFNLGLAPHPAMNMYDTTIIGKIKLEADDA